MRFKTQSKVEILLRISSFTLSFILSLFLILPEVLPESGHAERGVVTEPSLTLASGGEVVMELVGGTYGEVTEQISVSTNNYTGYTLTLQTSGSSTDLVNIEDENLIIPSLVTGAGGVKRNAINGNYGYSLNGEDFMGVPSVDGGGDVIKETNSASGGVDTINLTFGAQPDVGTVAGTYTNTFVIAVKANEVGYWIEYDPNAGEDTVGNMPSPLVQGGSVSGATAYLDSAVPTRGGYEFLGWAESAEAETADYAAGGTIELDPETENGIKLYAVWELSECAAGRICYAGNGDDGTGTMSDQEVANNANVVLSASNFARKGYAFEGWNTMRDGSGTTYGPMQTIRTGNLSVGGMQLYAKWLKSEGLLQNWTGCADLETNEVTALTDFRDGEAYLVAKLADGKCWMSENMRLDVGGALLSRANTNSPTDDFLAKAKVAEPTSNMCKLNTDPTCINAVIYTMNNLNRSLRQAMSGDNGATAWYSYGAMYNWFTATAGNGTLEKTSGSTTGDLCPSGWRGPTGGASGDFALLNTSVNNGATTNDVGLRTYPVNYIWSGDYSGTGRTGAGRQGRSWAVTAASTTNAFRLGWSSTTATATSNSWNKWVGFPLRCIARTNNPVAMGNVHYDPNGGVGTMEDEVGVNLYTVAAKTNTFLRSGYLFSGWNTAADGSGVNILNGDMLAEAAESLGLGESDTLNLYAIWGQEVSLFYNPNGGTGGPGTRAEIKDGETHDFIVSAVAPTWMDHVFLGWSLDKDASEPEYVAGDVLTTSLVRTTLYAIWREANCASFSICYRGNGADAGIGLTHAVAETDTAAELKPVDFSRTGYGFLGWNTEADGSGTTYGPIQTFTLPDLSEEGQILYAKWLKASGTMQSFSGCASMQAGQTVALTDTRDGNTYAVAKLADGKCWMMENLRLDPSKVELSSENTNAPTATFIEEVQEASSSITMCGVANAECVNQVAFLANNIDRRLNVSASANNNNSSLFSYGVLYNWYTVTAGNGTFEMASGNVVGDLCPSGWRLPTGGAGGEMGALNTAINRGYTNRDEGWRTFPANFVHSGDHSGETNGGIDQGRGTYARYWSATAASQPTAYRLGLAASQVTATDRAFDKWDAFTARCVAQ